MFNEQNLGSFLNNLINLLLIPLTALPHPLLLQYLFQYGHSSINKQLVTLSFVNRIIVINLLTT
jgi:hypothetical protein